MGKPTKYEPAHRQLRTLLAEAREEGLSFEAAWNRAVRPTFKLVTTDDLMEARPSQCVVWPADTRSRQLIRAACLDNKEAWERGYLRVPATPAEQALMQLASELRLEDYDEEPLLARTG